MTIINNALSGALAAQVAISASSQNIANLQTKGYTRQGALLAAVGPDASGRSAGGGVQVSSLLRFSDNYKSQAMWRAASEQGLYSQSQPYLTQLESVMSDEDASISAGIDKFFQALNAVAGDPGSTPLRQQRSAIVDSANAQIATIARLNQQITETRATGASVSALIDTRDQAIDDLAGKMALEVQDNPDGSRDVSLKSGQALVLGSMHGRLSAAATATSPQEFRLEFAGTSYGLDATKMGGQLGGLAQYETNTLLKLQADTAELAQQVASRVNAQLASGFKPDGAVGSALLVYTPGSGSDMLKVVSGFKAEELAFSADGQPGDTRNLQKLVAIRNQSVTLPTLGTMLLSDADTQIVAKLAVDSQLNKAALKTSSTVRTQAVDDWQSTSGVNQDEEAVNLVEYQNMYQANMKVISVANALFDATLAMMG